MANTRKVLLSLHTEVADRLGQETNKSAVVDALVAAHYGLNFEGGSTASSKRQSILDSITAAKAALVQPTTEPVTEVAPQEGEAQPAEIPTFVAHTVGLVSAPSDFVPVVQPLDPVEPAITSEVQADEPQVAESTFVPVVTPLEDVAITPEETVEAEPEEEFITEPEPEVVAADEPEPTVEEVPVAVPTGVRTCPTCNEPMVTAICLNCL